MHGNGHVHSINPGGEERKKEREEGEGQEEGQGQGDVEEGKGTLRSIAGDEDQGWWWGVSPVRSRRVVLPKEMERSVELKAEEKHRDIEERLFPLLAVVGGAPLA